MAFRDITDHEAVASAMAELDRVGEPAFLEKYGFRESRRYRIWNEGKSYPSKAILAAAHGYQFPDTGPLSYTDFSGGSQTTAKAKELGFDIVETTDELGVALAAFMALHKETAGQQFSADHPASTALRKAAEIIEQLLPIRLRQARVRPSVGQGNWATIPWIAILEPDVTNTTQEGVYPVLLFQPDMEAVEVSIAQGVTKLNQVYGRREATQHLTTRADQLRPHLALLSENGFALDSDYSLGSTPLARDYVTSTVLHRRFDRGLLPNSDVTAAVLDVLQAYGDLLEHGLLSDGSNEPAFNRALMVYVGQGALHNFRTGGQDGWWGWKDAPSGLEVLQAGDLIAFAIGFSGGSPRVNKAIWQRQSISEITVGRITMPVQRTDELIMPDEKSGHAYYPWKIRFELLGTEHDVPLTPGHRLSVEASDGLKKSVSRGVGIPVPMAGSPLFEEYVHHMLSRVNLAPPSVAAAANAFVSEVDGSGLLLRPDDVRAFLAALMAKPFAVLTGLSGSGKTQLAKRLGEWFGSDDQGRPRYLVVPVRPDWTGPEFLFGYPDVLRSDGNREVWSVPDPLEFMLRAKAEADEPFLLLLDEMNLAHVERYFADFLSGLESREPVLPELQLIGGDWTASGNSQRIPIPRNLFVAGTVNVDETTYQFSPKVLDRAFTFEFRTSTADLDPTLHRPGAAAAASSTHRTLIAAIAGRDDWQHEFPHPEQDQIFEDLRGLHELLTGSGHEFGHRVLYESLRYAALLGAMAFLSQSEVLDRIVLTKLLPKMHGTRSRLEKPLAELLAFANGRDPINPALPLTAVKAERMLYLLRETQFVSFTE